MALLLSRLASRRVVGQGPEGGGRRGRSAIPPHGGQRRGGRSPPGRRIALCLATLFGRFRYSNPARQIYCRLRNDVSRPAIPYIAEGPVRSRLGGDASCYSQPATSPHSRTDRTAGLEKALQCLFLSPFPLPSFVLPSAPRDPRVGGKLENGLVSRLGRGNGAVGGSGARMAVAR